MSRSVWLFASAVSLLSIHASSVSSAQGASSCFREQAELEASGSPTDQYFGVTVALSGDTALAGAFGDDDNGPDSGSTYVFVRAGSIWTFQTKLLPSDAAPQDRFGSSVSSSGDTALVGTEADDDHGASSGSAYVFVRNGASWTQQAKLVADDGIRFDNFGSDVSLSGDTALVSSAGNADGSAYVFVRSGTSWTREAKLQAMDGPVYEYFAHSVAVSGDVAVIGDTSDNEDDPYSGAAYVFVRYGTE